MLLGNTDRAAVECYGVEPYVLAAYMPWKWTAGSLLRTGLLSKKLPASTLSFTWGSSDLFVNSFFAFKLAGTRIILLRFLQFGLILTEHSQVIEMRTFQ